MGANNLFEGFYRVHDTAVMNWIQGLHVDYGDGNMGNGPLLNPARNDVPIISVLASPDRAFAAAKDLLLRTGWITAPVNSTPAVSTAEDNADLLNGLPLPLCSIYRGDEEPDLTLANNPAAVETAQSSGLYYPFWKKFWIPYQIEFWTQKVYTINFVREWVRGQLGVRGCLQNEVYITVAHASPWGNKYQSLQLDSMNDNSDLEGNDPRYKRHTASIRLRGLMIQNQVSYGQF